MTNFWRIRRGHLAALAAGIAIGISVIGTAAAVSAGPAVTVKHYTIAASGFVPDELNAASADYSNSWYPAILQDKGLRCFSANVVLPNRARLRSITFFLTNGHTSTFYGELTRQNLPAHTSKTLASTSPKQASKPTYIKVTKTIKSTVAVVDTSRFAYAVGVCPEGDATFSGVMINYTS